MSNIIRCIVSFIFLLFISKNLCASDNEIEPKIKKGVEAFNYILESNQRNAQAGRKDLNRYVFYISDEGCESHERIKENEIDDQKRYIPCDEFEALNQKLVQLATEKGIDLYFGIDGSNIEVGYEKGENLTPREATYLDDLSKERLNERKNAIPMLTNQIFKQSNAPSNGALVIISPIDFLVYKIYKDSKRTVVAETPERTKRFYYSYASLGTKWSQTGNFVINKMSAIVKEEKLMQNLETNPQQSFSRYVEVVQDVLLQSEDLVNVGDDVVFYNTSITEVNLPNSINKPYFFTPSGDIVQLRANGIPHFYGDWKKIGGSTQAVNVVEGTLLGFETGNQRYVSKLKCVGNTCIFQGYFLEDESKTYSQQYNYEILKESQQVEVIYSRKESCGISLKKGELARQSGDVIKPEVGSLITTIPKLSKITEVACVELDVSDKIFDSKPLVKEQFSPTGGDFRKIDDQELAELEDEAADKMSDLLVAAIKEYPGKSGLYKHRKFYHIINRGRLLFPDEEASAKKYQILEDRLQYLKEIEGVDVYVIYENTNFLLPKKDNSYNKFAKKVFDKAVSKYSQISNKKLILVTIPYAYPEKYITGVNWQYLMPGVNVSGSFNYDDFSSAKYENSYQLIYSIYKSIEKPYRIYVGRLDVDENITFDFVDKGRQTGKDVINELVYLKNPGYDEVKSIPHPKLTATGSPLGMNDFAMSVTEEDISRYHLALYQYNVEKETKIAQYRQIPVSDWQKVSTNSLKEAYIVEYYMAYGYRYAFNGSGFLKWWNSLNDLMISEDKFPATSLAVGYRQLFEALNGGQVSFADIDYGFDAMTVIDPIIYTAVDIMGVIPGVDNVADFVGLAYSFGRGDAENIQAYLVAVAITGAGAVVVKGIQKAGKYIIKGMIYVIEEGGKVKRIIKINTAKHLSYLSDLFKFSDEANLIPISRLDEIDEAIKKGDIGSKELKEITSQTTDQKKVDKLEEILGRSRLTDDLLTVKDGKVIITSDEFAKVSGTVSGGKLIPDSTLPISKVNINGVDYPLPEGSTISKYDFEGVQKAVISGLCFVAGTKVKTTHINSKSIEEMEVGDEIVSYDHSKEENVKSRVVKLFKRTVRKLAVVTIGTATFLSTVDHPFFANGKYVEASKLNSGDTVTTIDGTFGFVKSVLLKDTTVQVYNFEVEGTHNYYIGEKGYLVHNQCRLLEIETAIRAVDPKLIETSYKSFFNNVHKLEEGTRAAFTRKVVELGDNQKIVAFVNDFAAKADDISLFAKNTNLVNSWEVLFKEGDEIAAALRRNPDNLKKLNDYIVAEGADLTKLKNSFGNTTYPEKWLELKIPKNKLDETFTTIKNDPPANIDPWTPEHKAQRWNNYKEGDGTLDFESWSNSYDGNINKAVKGNKKVKDYASNNGLDIPESGFERTWRDPDTGLDSKIEIDLRGEKVEGFRRHDIYDEDLGKAVEIKDYRTQNVSKSVDIEREALMDIKLLKQGLLEEVEWVFLGNGPSGPLRELLIEGGIKISP